MREHGEVCEANEFFRPMGMRRSRPLGQIPPWGSPSYGDSTVSRIVYPNLQNYDDLTVYKIILLKTMTNLGFKTKIIYLGKNLPNSGGLEFLKFNF